MVRFFWRQLYFDIDPMTWTQSKVAIVRFFSVNRWLLFDVVKLEDEEEASRRPLAADQSNRKQKKSTLEAFDSCLFI